MDPSPPGRQLAHGFLCPWDEAAVRAEYINTVDQWLTIASKKYDVLKAMVCLEHDLNVRRFNLEWALAWIRAQRRRSDAVEECVFSRDGQGTVLGL